MNITDYTVTGSIFADCYSKKSNRRRNTFSAEEDEQLVQAVEEYGEENWEKVSKSMGQRSPRQCRDRWRFYLSPNANLSQWTENEDKTLMEIYYRIGNHWSAIAEYFPGRTWASVRNRCCRLERNKNRFNSDENSPRMNSEKSFSTHDSYPSFSDLIAQKNSKVLLPSCQSLPFISK